MKTITDKVLTLLLALFMITYGFYQGFRFVDNPYQTEIAYDYTVSDSYTSKGFFIRKEKTFNLNSDGVIHYLYDNGTKVNEGTLIAEYFDSEEEAKKQNTYHIIEQEIDELNKIETNTSVNYSGTATVSKQISSAVLSLNESVYSGKMYDIDDFRSQLLSSINKRNIISGKVENFESKINELEEKLSRLGENQINENQKIFSTMNGFFVNYSDGLENEISTERLDELSLEMANEIINNYSQTNNTQNAKIVESHNWYFALIVPQNQLNKFLNNSTVKMDFPTLNLIDIPAKVYDIIQEDGENDSVVVLKSNYIIKELMEQRVTEINVRFKAYNGLKINSEAIRFKDSVKGVYIIDDQQIKFKPIEVAYEGNGYILTSTKSKLENTVNIFDEVVVEGVELYDGKPIK
ncbi:MAG: HlyD family efflux transporter periplasmic adaptor subunit [Oscillospiraceae bacterium]